MTETLFDKYNASVVVVRSDYPGLKPNDRWTGTVSVQLKDGTGLKLTTQGHSGPQSVLDGLGSLLHRRLIQADEPID